MDSRIASLSISRKGGVNLKGPLTLTHLGKVVPNSPPGPPYAWGLWEGGEGDTISWKPLSRLGSGLRATLQDWNCDTCTFTAEGAEAGRSYAEGKLTSHRARSWGWIWLKAWAASQQCKPTEKSSLPRGRRWWQRESSGGSWILGPHWIRVEQYSHFSSSLRR